MIRKDGASASDSSSAAKILVVDDEDGVRENLSRLLTFDGYRVYTASTGEEALRVSKEVAPDVVLLDFTMPGDSGLDVCTEMRRTAPDAPSIIFVSGAGNCDLRTKALDTGAVDFVDKPFDYPELRARIDSVLRTRSYIERLALRASTDPLTGLANRSTLAQRSVEMVHAARRYERDLSCLFIDIDNFKTVNDELDHGVGDAVIREVANRLRITCRESDTVARYGGDEFVVLAVEASHDDAQALAERIRTNLAAPPPPGTDMPSVTVSVGVATLGPDWSASDLFRQADAALQSAKRTGRDRVEVANGDPRTIESRRIE